VLGSLLVLVVACSVSPCPAESETRLESLYASAQAAQRRGDYRAAATSYEEILKLRPELAEAWANAGLMHQFLGEYQIADRQFQVALQKNPRLYVPNLFLGLNLLRRHQPNAAIPYLDRAERLNPHDVQAALGLARAYEGAGDFAKANNAFHRATEVDSRDSEAWYGLGVTGLSLQKSAVEQLRRLHVNSAYARSLVAEAFVDQGRPNDAIQIYRKLLEAQPAPPCLRSALGFAYLRAKSLNSAAEMFHKELRESPGCLQARLGRARLALERTEKEEAFTQLGIVWEMDRNFLQSNLDGLWEGLSADRLIDLQAYLQQIKLPSPEAELAARLLASIRGSSSSAVSGAEASQAPQGKEIAKRFPNAEKEATSFVSLVAEGRYTDCTNHLKSRLPGISLSQSLLLARCAYYAADYKTSLLASGNALQANPQDLAALYWRAEAAGKLAIYALVRTSTEAPDSFRTHLLLGEVHRSKEEYKAAESEFAKVVAVKPDDPIAHLGLARVYYANTHFPEALEELGAVLKADPVNPGASFLLGEILVKQRQYPEAVAYLKKALQGQPFTIPRVHSLLSTCYAAEGQIQQAISELKAALSEDTDGVFHYQMYRLQQRAGNNEAARAALERSEVLREKTAKDQRQLLEGTADP
jgi:tetratricopeptide (TPR) repeat protein